MTEYNAGNISIGDQVRADGEKEWGTVTWTGPTVCKADYGSENYTLQYWIIVEHKPKAIVQTATPVPAFNPNISNGWDGTGFPPVGTIVEGRDGKVYRVKGLLRKNISVENEAGENLRGRPGYFSPTTRTFNAMTSATVNTPTTSAAVRPGMIVLYPKGSKYGQDANRLWVVLSETKNSQGQDVNIIPVNPDSTFRYKYVRTPKGYLKPVAFKSLVKPDKP